MANRTMHCCDFKFSDVGAIDYTPYADRFYENYMQL